MSAVNSIEEMLSETLFPGNQDAFQRLKSLLETGRITTFVGAGASVPLYPSWKSLLTELVSKAKREGLISETEYDDTVAEVDNDPLYCATVIQRQLQKPIFRAELARIFRDRSECTLRHRLIVRLPAKAHVTLNYDNGLEVACVEERRQYPNSIKSHERSEIIRWQQGELFSISGTSILHWHGSASLSDEMIFTGEDYLRFYQDSFNETFIKTLWQNHQLLVIGFGFTDPFLTSYAERVLGLLESDRRHFALIGRRAETPISASERRKFVTKYKLDPIFYEVVVRDDGSEDHSGLETLLQSLLVPQNGETPPRGDQPPALSKVMNSQPREADLLQSASYKLPIAKQHRSIRQVEQSIARSAIKSDRYLWIVSDWGMGSDEFIASVLDFNNMIADAVYRIDLGDFENVDSFSTILKVTHNMTMETFCRMLSVIGEAYLVLDNIALLSSDRVGGLLSDVESTLKIILDYCPQLRVFLRTRRMQEQPAGCVITLGVLDEADTLNYVSHHPNGGSRLSNSETINAIYKHSGGVPTRLDATINSLRFLSVEELIENNPEFLPVISREMHAPTVIARTISEISNAEDPSLQRAYKLLCVLCTFPHGEQFGRIRHILRMTPLFVEQAEILANRGLIDIIENSNITLGSVRARGNLLLIPRMIREYVRSTISSSDLIKFDELVAEMYFGPDWMTGKLKSGVAYGFDAPQREPHEIANASNILLRILKMAERDSNARMLDGGLNAASTLLNQLIAGHHYQSAVSLGLDLLRIYPEERKSNIVYLRYQLGRSLRMLGLHEHSKKLLTDLPSVQLPKHVRQSVLVNLALSYQSLGEIEEAARVARECTLIDARSHSTLQARAILAEIEPSSDERSKKLDQLEKESRRKGATVVANNIALTRARELKNLRDKDSSEATLLRVMSSAKDGEDFYNAIRASIQIASMKIDQGASIGELEKSLLIASYQFLYNERIPAVFNQCHDVLWKLFLVNGEVENLLSLFRYSSLVWRFTNDLRRELIYGRQVASLLKSRSENEIRSFDQKTAYCFMRVKVLLSDGGDKDP